MRRGHIISIDRFNSLVNLTPVLFRLVKHPANRFWKTKRFFLETGHFYGRNRNVYSIAIRRLQKAWQNARSGRKALKSSLSQCWQDRIAASTESLGCPYNEFVHGLSHHDIALDRKVFADLAWSEPRTFRSLVELAKTEQAKDPASQSEPSTNVLLETPDSRK